MKRLVYVFIGVAVAIVVFSTLATSVGKNNQTDTTKDKATSTPTPVAEQKTDGTKEIQISAGEYYFLPSSIKINKGDTVTVTLRNVGKMPHNIVFESPEIATKTILSGQSDTIEFTATESGQSRFYSSVANDREQGMEGDLGVK
jgi:plastocyanin